MDIFRPVFAHVLLPGEPAPSDIYVRTHGRLVRFVAKGAAVTGGHKGELERIGAKKIYVRTSQWSEFEEYVRDHAGRILTAPDVPSHVKAEAFYVSSICSLRKAFDNPDGKHLEEIKRDITPLLRGVMKNEIVLADLIAMTSYDFTTYTHSVNVGIYATALTVSLYKGLKSMDLSELERLSYGFFLHDIGKSRVPKDILGKKGPLDEDEWALMKKHPEWGYEILMETGALTEEAAYISLQHHERPNGSGYPLGMTDIHPCARICAMADVFDALVSKRPYKASLVPFDAIKFLKDQVYTEFDQKLLVTFIRMLGPEGRSPEILARSSEFR